jgi:hypothetical protein
MYVLPSVRRSTGRFARRVLLLGEVSAALAGRALRKAPRLFANAVLHVPYVMGKAAGLLVVAALSIAAAAQLGWIDGRGSRKGRHGAA